MGDGGKLIMVEKKENNKAPNPIKPLKEECIISQKNTKSATICMVAFDNKPCELCVGAGIRC